SVALCASHTRPPPTLTPSPYTTLFRSPGDERAERDHLTVREVRELRGAVDQRQADRRHRDDQAEPRAVEQRARQAVPVGDEHAVDRKSTRLNSSHVSISYAVFCLKKKK